MSAVSISKEPLDDPADARPAGVPSPNDILDTGHDVGRVGDSGHTVHDSPANVSSTAETRGPATVISGGGKLRDQLLRLNSGPQLQLQVLKLQLCHLVQVSLAHVVSLGGCYGQAQDKEDLHAALTG